MIEKLNKRVANLEVQSQVLNHDFNFLKVQKEKFFNSLSEDLLELRTQFNSTKSNLTKKIGDNKVELDALS